MIRSHPVSRGDRILEPMIALARCSKQERIVVAGSKSIELTSELNRRGFIHVESTANCGRAAGQYDVALVDWRRRTFQALDTTLDWLVDFLKPGGLLVVWIDPRNKPCDKTFTRDWNAAASSSRTEPFMSLAPRSRRGDARQHICRLYDKQGRFLSHSYAPVSTFAMGLAPLGTSGTRRSICRWGGIPPNK
jgi:hypothetical protein